MTQVDFYVLRQTGEQARRIFACKLAEKAYRLEHSVHIEAASEAEAAELDTLLWTFRDGSFVPHEVVGAKPAESPVTIGYPGSGGPVRDLLINLGPEIPDSAASFPRVAELVSSDDESKQQSRARFANYREQGHEIKTHKL